jgi:hypothetical protein
VPALLTIVRPSARAADRSLESVTGPRVPRALGRADERALRSARPPRNPLRVAWHRMSD